jgi:hypothetical protein
MNGFHSAWAASWEQHVRTPTGPPATSNPIGEQKETGETTNKVGGKNISTKIDWDPSPALKTTTRQRRGVKK